MKVSEAIAILATFPPDYLLEVGSDSICMSEIESIEAMGDDDGTVAIYIGDPIIMDEDCNQVGKLSEIMP